MQPNDDNWLLVLVSEIIVSPTNTRIVVPTNEACNNKVKYKKCLMQGMESLEGMKRTCDYNFNMHW